MNHTVNIQSASESFVCAAGDTILNAATSAGVSLPYGCGNGFCGACKAKIASGKTVYEDGFVPNLLSEDDISDGMVLCCKAMVNSDIELVVDQPKKRTSTTSTTVQMVEKLSHNVICLRLGFETDNLPTFEAGQYVNFHLPNGKIRAFSIANMPKVKKYIEFHIKHNLDGVFTNQLFNGQIKLGDKQEIEIPLGNFLLKKDNDKPIIMAATGTGFAPIKAMIEQWHENQDPRPIKLFWGARLDEDLYLHDLLNDWAYKFDCFDYIPVLSKPSDNWQGQTGYITDAILNHADDLSKHQIYIAGLPAMVNDAERMFKYAGCIDVFCDAFEFGE